VHRSHDTGEYRRYIEHDAAPERRFQPIIVNPPTVEQTIKILQGLKERYESHHKVRYTDSALISASILSDRFISDRYLPDKAIDLIDEAGSHTRLLATQTTPELKDKEIELEKLVKEKERSISQQKYERAARLRDKEREMRNALDEMKKNWRQNRDSIIPDVTEEDIATIVSKWTNIPVTKITEKESERLVHMEEELHRRVIGQDESINSISQAIRRSRTGLKDPKRPIGSFLFLGPTGVGKTELARALAEFLFGDENALVRVDMSEYMEKFSVSRLIGAPPGYVGYEEGGQLTEKIRRKPYSVILIDEIEKAHQDVFNILLQIMEDGILTDSFGHKVSFKNAIIIMTSNIGAKLISRGKALGFLVQEDTQQNYQSIKDTVLEEVKKVFNPEFLNRIDEIIVFHPLSREDMKKILDLMLARVEKKVLEKGFTIEISDRAKEFLLEKGFDPNFGARPLTRTIQRYLENPFGEEILSKNLLSGTKEEPTKVSVGFDSENQKLSFIANIVPKPVKS